MKVCQRCSVEKPLDEFYSHRTKGKQAWCKACFSEHKSKKYAENPRFYLDRQKARRLADPDRMRLLDRARRERNPERYKAMQRRWYEANPEKVFRNHRRHLLRRKGLTPEEYDLLLNSQAGVCAICEARPGKRSLVVDHDHATGIIRGLLCTKCNAGLGLLGDDLSGLERAVAYLYESQKEALAA